MAGRPIVVWTKRRRRDARFHPHNISATRHMPEEIFSADEVVLIGRFVEAMGADWCGLDVLRDRHFRRIYIVDVNKTDAGPIIALPLRDKLASTALLAAALRLMIQPNADEG